MLQVHVVVRGKLANNSRIEIDGARLTMPEGSRIRDLVGDIGLLDDEVKRVSVNGRRGRLDQALRRNDRIEISG